MYEFNYHRPGTLEEAKKMLSASEDPKIIAGGMTLLPTMKFRLARPSDLIDLGNISKLHGIRDDGDSLFIAAMTIHAEVASNELVRAGIPALAELAGNIGDPQVRNRGTLGGSIANNDPAADYPAALLALDAVVQTDKRSIPSERFLSGMFETALQSDEIVTGVTFSRPKRAAYAKFPNPASRYAIAGVMVAEYADSVRVAVTGAAACAFRAAELEQALSSDFSAAALDGLEIDAGELNSDLHASPEYRAHLVILLAKRAVAAAGG
ncbi:MAG: xanthine dehydrogenase family protein subunit M [Gammaproteobacteria bacterium]|nr:xanthine dehydrogenase family protein subunit M [Gammaproteobacteria bacterium]MDH4313862.1 xanthine dehydrogenase family protein subunit M [Gammaproteobacteria bacterium]MDH5215199.1 xanthine dehydrogenase family protein subunit M [Gammaproteobacteria bacterium]MDH5499533.1 xanthine dehydrogenase family protein subunit M [Gammaproteobacteria bacterium]